MYHPVTSPPSQHHLIRWGSTLFMRIACCSCSRCPVCSRTCNIEKTSKGTLSITQTCPRCENSYTVEVGLHTLMLESLKLVFQPLHKFLVTSYSFGKLVMLSILCRTQVIFPPASSQGPLLLFWEWFALFTPKYVSGMTAAWSLGVYTCVLLFVQMNVIPSGACKLLPRMNQTCGGLQLFSEVMADLFLFSHDVKQRGTEFEVRPWNISTGTLPIDSNDVN